ncbi:MAG: MFS transporter [Sphingomonadales bacterium]
MGDATQQPASNRIIWAMVLLLGLAILLNYVDRGTLGVAGPLIRADLGLSPAVFGMAASAFFWVYAPVQLGIGWLVDRVSTTRLLALGLALWGLATIATAAVQGLALLLALRLLLALGESVAFPAAYKLIAVHVPVPSQARAVSVVSMGLALGPVVGTLGGGLLQAAFGWRPMFLVMGAATLLWLLPWLLVMRRLPQVPLAPPRRDDGSEAGLFSVMRQPAFWMNTAYQFGWSYGLYFLISWLPSWLVEARGYSLADMAWVASLVYVAQAAAAFVAGRLGTRSLRGSPAAMQRLLLVAGALMEGLGIIALLLAPPGPALLAALALAGAGIGCGHVAFVVAMQIYAGPQMIGRWSGFQNAIANSAGIASPLLAGWLVGATGSYASAFVLAAGLSGVSLLLALLLPRIRPLAW